MNKESNIRIAEFNLKSVNSWIEFADKKAGFFLTIALALFTVSFSVIPDSWQTITNLLVGGNKLSIGLGAMLAIIFCVYFILAILGIYKLITVIKPRTNPATKRKSVLYYATIANMDIERFKQIISELSSDEIINELSDQTYNNATVARGKYEDVALAVEFLQIAGFLGIIFIVLILIL